jgi:hypothetical protein
MRRAILQDGAKATAATGRGQANLIMPEPTVFLSSSLPVCSIIRPTATQGAALRAFNRLTADGLFIGQSQAFFATMQDLATKADMAQRGV